MKKYTMTCEECEKEFDVDFSEPDDVETEVHDPDRQMGAELVHTSTVYGKCPHCQEDYTAVLEEFEYPEGAEPEAVNPPEFR